ncbi:uncharacterized protein LOC141617271 [Silene latifolia]|uniref:uncharacterized protein LOC141617271 n=1 Tax=Silene latifolia TaxID=37657 RepID=UPI003D77FBA1
MGMECTTNDAIENAFLEYYMSLLGSDHPVTFVCLEVVRSGTVVSEDQANALIRDISEDEIRSALMSIPAEKSPGPDEFTCQFFKDVYPIVGPDVEAAVKEFFFFWETLTIICSRLNEVLGGIVSCNQSAFIKSRDIVDNLLICQDLVRHAPETELPSKMVQWIMTCVSSPSFSLSLNGAMFGYFKDDLLLFSRGDFSSIKILMRALTIFDAASGLQVNHEKSEIFMNGISPRDRDKFLRLSGFRAGVFPFRIFILPSTIINKIDSICRNYLWSGDLHYKLPLVAWETCCRPLDEGGLVIINCCDWNKAMLAKYTWWIANKEDHLWIKWVNAIYIRGQDWWNYSPSPSSSWTWRQICKVKEQFKDGFINDTWLGGEYTIQKGYGWLKGSRTKVRWKPFIWNKLSLPKHNFILWPLALQRLLTRDRLAKFGVDTATTCYLCNSSTESCSHLFFYCIFSRQCLVLVQSWLGIDLAGHELLEWCMNWRCRSLAKKQIVFAGLASLVYHIWLARNKCRLEGVVILPTVLLQQTKDAVRHRIIDRIAWFKHGVDCNWLHRIRS